jgi:type I restriction enzyme, S subunit
VIEDLKPYPETKDSGLAWLGEIPAHWNIKRNGSLFQQRNAVGEPDWPILEVSLRTGVRIREFGSSKRKQVMSDKAKYKCAAKGDYVYNMMRMWQGAAGIAPVDGLVSPAYVVAKPLPHANPAYFASLFRTDDYLAEIDAFSRGIVKDRNRLYWDQFKQIPTPCPPTEEQTAIARFLTWATNRLDRTIRAKRRIIALLNEQKQAIIHRAVTRGLDPSVPMKDSGIPWLGEIPEHWEVTALRRHWTVTDCKHLTVTFVENGVPLASVREVRNFELDLSECRLTTPEWYQHLIQGDRKPEEGDIIYCRNVSVGSSALVTADAKFAMGQDVCLIRSELQSQQYLNYLLQSSFMKKQLELLLVGSTFKRVNIAQIKALTVVIPPRQEQDKIGRHLAEELTAYETATSRLEREITLIREYRTRLIADVVTGKLDVRQAAAGLPEEIEPLDAGEPGVDIEELEPDEEENLELP